MKKIYSLLALFLFTIAGTVQAQTQWVIDGDPLTEITAGQKVVLQEGINTGGWSQGHYLNVDLGMSPICSPVECVYEFEEMGTVSQSDGDFKTYVLKSVATGQYLSDGDKTYVSSKTRAFVFTAKLAVELDAETIEASQGDLSYNVYADRCAGAEGQTFVFCKEDKSVAMGFVGAPNFASWYDTDNWYVYAVNEAEASGDLLLDDFFALYLPEGLTDGMFPAGDGPGQCPEEIRQQLQDAYDNAQNLLAAGTASNEELIAAYNALKAAYEACKAGVIQIKAGFYQMLASGGRGVFDNGTGTRWTSNYSPITEVDYDKAAYIWEFIPSENKEDDKGHLLFNVRNFATERYIGTHTGNSAMIPTTVDPEEEWYIVPSTEADRGGYFNVVNVTRGSDVSMNADPAGPIVFWAYGAGDNSYFQFVPVPEEVINEMKDGIVQTRLMGQLEDAYAAAQTAYEKGRYYTLSADCSVGDYAYDLPGVFTYNNNEDAPNAWTNAPEPAEGSNGPAGLLFDGDLTTYFHSSWSTDMAGSVSDGKEFHFLQLELDQAIQNVTLKYTQRRNNGGWPLKFLVESSDDGETWTTQCELPLPYDVAAPEDYTGYGGKTGYTAFKMDAAHKFLRLTSLDNGQNKLFWHMAEMRIYEGGGEYDTENSVYETVEKQYRDELEKWMAAAAKELEAGEATEATIKALKAAVEAFNEHYPDMTIVNDLKAEAESWIAAGPENEGEEIGNYQSGATAELEAAVAKAVEGIKDHMTFDEIQAVKEALRAAINDFNNKLITPNDGAVYVIRSLSEGEPGNNYLYMANTDTTAVVKYGYYDAETGAADITDRLNTLWRLHKYEDGTFSFQNLATGLYIGNPAENNVKVFVSDVAEKIGLRYARTPQGFNLVMAEEIFANAQPGTGNLVTWGNAEGADNSAFQFIPAEFNGMSAIDVYPGQYRIYCLPYSVFGSTDFASFYQVLGVKDSAVQLAECDGDAVIPAGTPFIYWMEEGGSNEAVTDVLYTEAETVEEINHAYKVLDGNGLIGTMYPVEIVGSGYGILEGDGSIIVTEDGEEVNIGANSGYFGAVPATDEDGAVALKFEGELTSIQNAVIVKNNNVDVYNLAGVKVRQSVKNASATNGLPQGLYIVGGKKVLVK